MRIADPTIELSAVTNGQWPKHSSRAFRMGSGTVSAVFLRMKIRVRILSIHTLMACSKIMLLGAGTQLRAWLHNSPSHGQGPVVDRRDFQTGDWYDVEFDIQNVIDP